MESTPQQPLAYRFGPFRLNLSERLLEQDGARIAVTPKVVDTLVVLLANAGQLLSKEDLMQAVWPDVSVAESGLTRNISVLRKALETGCAEGTYIETIPRRGYRFVAPVELEFPLESSFPEEPPIAHVPIAHSVVARRSDSPITRRVAISLALALAVFLAARLWWPSDTNASVPATDPNIRIGEHLLAKLSAEESGRALDYFRRAVSTNPQSADAYAGIAISHVQLMALGGMPPAEAIPQAAKAAEQALTLNPRSGIAHTAAAAVAIVRDGDYARADREFRQALSLSPELLTTRLYYARLATAFGRFEEARDLLESALRQDPASPAAGTQLCQMFYYKRDFERAAAECRGVLDREPGYSLAHYYLGLSLAFQGKLTQARENLLKSSIQPGALEVDLAWLHLLENDRAPMEAALRTRKALVQAGDVSASALMVPAALLGKREDVRLALASVLETRASELLCLRVEPRLDAVRDDPHFIAALRQTGLTGE